MKDRPEMMNLSERDTDVEEALDAPEGVDDRLVASSLRDLSRMEQLLGWTRMAVRDAAQVAEQRQWHTFSVLDVGTGAGNIPIALAQWARDHQREAQFTACDVSEQMLAVARGNCACFPEIHLERQNALALSYADQSFDLVVCQGVLHHFSPSEAPILLKELARVARHAVLVTDLQRSLPVYLGGWLLLHTLIRNPITRHDGLASIRRAYTRGEVRMLAEQVGLRAATLRSTLHFRQALLWQR
jgi:ubiquinone/menaquinone biosynthesis C-methylase UbiE